ncbi:SDR family NAD(P)-dependent oxidoreductase [Pseudomonas sp. PLMAX]|uniref:SDR family NAD(P)-dependent oxidoreductase n=1 Tax=Pseudomonas sp. PLMAX TaxID=2201998 RepID=UPI0038B7BB01
MEQLLSAHSLRPADRRRGDSIEHFGQIDVLINSAYAHGAWGSSCEASMADWRNAMDVNLFGTMHMTQAVLPQMKKQKSGSIVMINTMATRTPNQLESGYAVSKGALKTAVQYLAQDLGPFGIRVNSTFMGWMWGAPVIGYFESEAKRLGVPMESLVEQVTQQIPLRSLLAKNLRAPRGVRLPVSPLTSIASKLAPTGNALPIAPGIT